MAYPIKTIILLLFLWLLPLSASPQTPSTGTINYYLGNLNTYQFCPVSGEILYNCYPNAVLYYYGITGSDSLARIIEGKFHRWPEHIQSLEYQRTLSMENPVRQFFYPIVGVVQLAANVTMRQGRGQNRIYEFVPYIGFRWVNWPWNDIILTSFALGEGVSYTSSVPSLEKYDNDNTKRLLNYMLIEFTFALPSRPRVQLVARLHHRSGAFGLYRAGNTGSNNVGIGLKYLFD